MAKYVLIPDSFKGTLSSEDICRIASEEILRLEPEAEICAIPVADGGEGTVDAFLAAVGGTRAEVPCTGPCGQEVMGFYGLLPDGTAVVGVARRARALGVPAAALVGGCETALDAVYAEGVSGVFPIHPALCTWPQAAARTEEDLRFAVGNLLRFMAALRR